MNERLSEAIGMKSNFTMVIKFNEIEEVNPKYGVFALLSSYLKNGQLLEGDFVCVKKEQKELFEAYVKEKKANEERLAEVERKKSELSVQMELIYKKYRESR